MLLRFLALFKVSDTALRYLIPVLILSLILPSPVFALRQQQDVHVGLEEALRPSAGLEEIQDSAASVAEVSPGASDEAFRVQGLRHLMESGDAVPILHKGFGIWGIQVSLPDRYRKLPRGAVTLYRHGQRVRVVTQENDLAVLVYTDPVTQKRHGLVLAMEGAQLVIANLAIKEGEEGMQLVIASARDRLIPKISPHGAPVASLLDTPAFRRFHSQVARQLLTKKIVIQGERFRHPGKGFRHFGIGRYRFRVDPKESLLLIRSKGLVGERFGEHINQVLVLKSNLSNQLMVDALEGWVDADTYRRLRNAALFSMSLRPPPHSDEIEISWGTQTTSTFVIKCDKPLVHGNKYLINLAALVHTPQLQTALRIPKELIAVFHPPSEDNAGTVKGQRRYLYNPALEWVVRHDSPWKALFDPAYTVGDEESLRKLREEHGRGVWEQYVAGFAIPERPLPLVNEMLLNSSVRHGVTGDEGIIVQREFTEDGAHVVAVTVRFKEPPVEPSLQREFRFDLRYAPLTVVEDNAPPGRPTAGLEEEGRIARGTILYPRAPEDPNHWYADRRNAEIELPRRDTSGLEEVQEVFGRWGRVSQGSDAVVLSQELPGLEMLPGELRRRVYVVEGGLEEVAIKILEQVPAAERIWADQAVAVPLQRMLWRLIHVHPIKPGTGLEELLAQWGFFLGVPALEIQSGLEEIRRAASLAAAA